MNKDITHGDSTPRNTILVWDLPVRIGHWIGVLCFVTLWLTRDAGSLDVHAAAGYVLLAVVSFRIFWGFVGTRHARFTAFVYSPRAAFAYLRDAVGGRARHFAGHNPAGSWSVYLLLASVLATTLTGVFAIGGMFDLGPFRGVLNPNQAENLRDVHELLAWALLALVVLHLAGVAWSSRVHAENLVGAMFSGRKPAWNPSDAVTSRPAMGAALAVIVAIGAGAYLGQSGWPHDYAALRAASKEAAMHAPPTIWNKECDSCHFPYPPDFLAAESNAALLAQQGDHFGEDLGLDEARVKQLALFARVHAAPRTWASGKLQRRVNSGNDGLRVTRSPFWRAKHAPLENSFRAEGFPKPHACEACHGDAASGMFSPREIHIPEQETNQ